MAFLKLGNIKERKKGKPSEGLKLCINYICNKEKTEGKYIAGHNIFIKPDTSPDYAYEQMMDTKAEFNKMSGRQAYHYKLSFSPEENISPELAFEIAGEFVKSYLADYETVYTVHTNKAHIHAHIVFNSIDIVRGYKYQYKNGDWEKKLQPVINDICRKYNLSEFHLITEPEKYSRHRNKCYAVWKKENPEKTEKKSRTNAMILKDIRECIAKAGTYREFKELLLLKGYLYNDNPKHKYITVKAPGRERACRIVNLTPDKSTYTKENIIKMIGGTYNREAEKEIYGKLIADMRYFFTGNYTQINEVSSFAKRKGLKTREDVENYMIYLDSCKEILNKVKRQVQVRYDASSEAVEEVYKLLTLYKFYKLYKSGREKFKEEAEQTLEIYSSLKDRGYDPVCLVKLSIHAKRCITGIDEYNKHIFVEKKICERLRKMIDNKKEINYVKL